MLYKLISRWLLDQDYQQLGCDQCLLRAWRNADGQIDPSQSPDDQHGDFLFIGFHADDFLAVTTDEQRRPSFSTRSDHASTSRTLASRRNCSASTSSATRPLARS